MVVRAANVLTVGKPKSDDGLDAVAHDREWGSCDYPGSAACRIVRVDPELLAHLGQVVEIANRDQTASGVNLSIGRKTRVRRVDPPRIRARVPVVDRRVVLDARIG